MGGAVVVRDSEFEEFQVNVGVFEVGVGVGVGEDGRELEEKRKIVRRGINIKTGTEFGLRSSRLGRENGKKKHGGRCRGEERTRAAVPEV
ncbi:hypothetical protein M0R45_021554 [Rubus argutus]|uniref:Uncharacterized protein n=1 Tax=Rubus argutus TaxID=59490 RepID=A0AAW1XEQ4_RUBAR